MDWLPLLFVGCTPAYHAPSHHATLFDGGNQFSGRAALGFGGAQVQGAYAPVNHVAIRGSAQGFADTSGVYGVAGGGVEFFAAFRSPLRLAMGLEVNAGHISKVFRARSDLFFSREELVMQGLLVQAAVPYTVAWEWDKLATGVTGRAVFHTHPSRPDWGDLNAGPQGAVLSAEVAGMFRWGSGKVKGDVQFGLAIPVLQVDGGNRAYLPFNVAFGFVVDL